MRARLILCVIGNGLGEMKVVCPTDGGVFKQVSGAVMAVGRFPPTLGNVALLCHKSKCESTYYMKRALVSL